METKTVKRHTRATIAAMAPGEYACEEGTGVVVHRTAVSGKFMINDGNGGFEMVSSPAEAEVAAQKRRDQLFEEAKRPA